MFMLISRWILLRMINVAEKNFRENQKTHFMFNFYSENRVVYEIMWKNMVEPEATDGNVIRRMRIACCVTIATDTHSGYVIFIAFPLQRWSRARSSMLNLCLCYVVNFCTKGIYRRNRGNVSSYCHRHHHHYYRRRHHKHWWNIYHNSKILCITMCSITHNPLFCKRSLSDN